MPKVDENGNIVYELDEHGNPVMEYVYDDNGNRLLEDDGVTPKVPQNQPLAYVGPFRAYFQATTPNGARSLAMIFGGSYNPGEGSGPNAIGPVVRTIDADGTQRVFDLSGRPINGNVKGIVIKNGRKVVR